MRHARVFTQIGQHAAYGNGVLFEILLDDDHVDLLVAAEIGWVTGAVGAHVVAEAIVDGELANDVV